MIAAVTGGTGFIGSHLVEALIARGDTVRLLSRKEIVQTGSTVQNFVVDYQKTETLHKALIGCDVVYHLAAALRAPKQSDIIEINRSTANSLLTAVKQVSPNSNVVVCSSLAAAGPALNGLARTIKQAAEPTSLYGKSKRATEEAFEKHGDLNWTILRPPAVFGPRERDIFVFFKALSHGWSSQIGSIRRRFSWIYVRDFVDALLIADNSGSLNHQTHFVISGDTDWTEFRTVAAE